MSSKDYFEKVAGKWDQMREGYFTEKVRKVAVAKANIQAGTWAADIGAGTGFITEELIRNGLRVIAVDQSEAMLEVMKKKFGRLSTVEYRLGEFNNLPIQNETVDYIFNSHFRLSQVQYYILGLVRKGKVWLKLC